PRPFADTPLARVLGPALRDRDLASSLEPMRRLAADDPEDATTHRVLEAVKLLADSLHAHAAGAPGSKVHDTVPMMGLDRALFQVGMGNLEMAERVLQELAEAEPDNDIVERHLAAVQTVAAAVSGELTRTRISAPDPDPAAEVGEADGEDAWDEGTEVQGREEDPFDALDESSVSGPPPSVLASDQETAVDITGRAAVPEVTGRAAVPDVTGRAAMPEYRDDPRARCEDRGPVAVRPVVTVGTYVKIN
ncbi:MAG: hypothetical protein ACOCUS_03945, partial [Polyangiales bacterium]